VRWEKEDCGEYFEKCDRPDAANEWVEVHDAEVFCRFVEACAPSHPSPPSLSLPI
jgi:hypothetical protein